MPLVSCPGVLQRVVRGRGCVCEARPGHTIESALVNPGVTFGATSFARRRSTSSFLIRSLLAVRREFGSREGVEVVRLVAGACGSRLVTSEAESAFLLGCATFEAVWSSCM